LSALFKPWANTVFRVALVGLASGLAGSLAFAMVYVRSPLATGQHDPVQQPVQFDHRHHVGDEGIDCRYCHSSVEKSASAGIPPTSVCLNCHAQVWNKSPLLEPVRQAFFDDRPIAWRRVHHLQGFVYFNHSIHVAKGVGCETCHGRVDQMAAVAKAETLSMGWCLDCHRDPGPRLRPRDQVTAMGWTPPESRAERDALAQKLLHDHDVQTRTSCSTCHR
jgi:hypothetical protein